MYGCVSGLCQFQPELCENYVSKMAPLVFHNLDEKDPLIISNLWEAVLSLVNYLPVSIIPDSSACRIFCKWCVLFSA